MGKKKRSMEELFAMLPEVNFSALEKWTEKELFKQGYATVSGMKAGYVTTCRSCGRAGSLREFGSGIHNKAGRCPKCGRTVIFKDEWRGHRTLIDYGYFAVVRKMRNGTVLIRSFYADRKYDDNWERFTSLTEDMRIFVTPEGVKTFRHSYWGYWYEQKAVGKPLPYDFWANGVQYKLAIKWETDPEKTFLKYSCVKEFLAEKNENFPPNLTLYLELYVKYPVLTEKLMKEGFRKLIDEKISGNLPMRVVNFRKKTVAEALSLPKNRVRELKGCNGDKLRMAQFTQKHNATSPELHRFMSNFTAWNIPDLEFLLGFMSLNKLYKYIEKQHKPGTTYYNLVSDYCDYIKECRKLSFNLADSFILFPENLYEAHENTSHLIREKAEREKAEKQRERDKAFAEALKKLNKKYAFSADGFIIRPARGTDELRAEGAQLNHCVLTYAERYLKGETVILFIRRAETPDEPYYTMELDPKTEIIIQCRGKRNCGKTPEIEAFTEKWQKQLKKRKPTAA